MSSVRAVIKSGVVVNTIIADADDSGSVAIPEGLSVGIGWIYDGQTFTAPPPAPTWRRYDYAGFIDALTVDEAVAFVQAKSAQPRLEVWVELARVRGIDFNDVATRTAAPLLVSLGVLTAERLDELAGGAL